MVADQLGDKLPDFEADALRAIPVQAAGSIPSRTSGTSSRPDVPDRLRMHIAQFAREIAGKRRWPTTSRPATAALAGLRGAGRGEAKALPAFARAVLTPAACAERGAAPANGLDHAAGR